VSRLQRLLLVNITAPLAALVFAFLVSSIALLASGNDPVDAFTSMWSFGTRLDSLVIMINRATPLYISGIAVAIGFKMGLFNIGVEGQYLLAALVAASFGAAIALPSLIHIPLILLVAMLVGAAWAGIAGVLKAYRGVHEVISTIMLNNIATRGLIAYLLLAYLREDPEPGDLVIKTREIPESGWFPSLTPLLRMLGLEVRRGTDLQGFVLIAILVGVGYHLLITRTRFGFDLRASGLNAEAARASGVDARRMIVRAMVLSGAVAGLVGIGMILSFQRQYSIDMPTGLGFAGIAIALLGRNHPVGIALGALLFGFLERSSQILDLEGIPKEIVVIMQGVIVLSVVVAYELVFRIARAQEARAAAAATGALPPEESPGGPAEESPA
jgi:general nucleoside transport system permease protein